MIIFGGVEIPSNRTLLEKSNVQNVMLSYWGLRKRGLPKTKPYLIGEHFFPETKVWVDSGAVQADKANLSRRELEDYAADYEEFIALNYDRIEGWVEFDSTVLGLPWIQQQRAAFENDPKMWVVWHKDYSVALLQQWASSYSNIAIPNDAIEGVSSLAAITRQLASQTDVKFHALATAKPDNLRQIPFTTASTLSWLSPMRRGETIIWDGSKLVRYPKRMKTQARPRYKAVLQRAGLDFDKFVSDDTLESTKVAVWSYLQLEKIMDKDKPDLRFIKGDKPDKVADISDDTLYTSLMEMGIGSSDISGSEMRKVERKEVIQRDPQEIVSMPVFGYEMKTVVEQDEDGRDILSQVPVVQSSSGTIRQCNTCFVASTCPAFEADHTCKFNLPVQVKTRDQLKSLLNAMIEIQGQRVAFMRFQEELNGGYADPNTSQEIDRLFKLVKSVKELEENKEFIRITAERQTSGGILSSIFGDRAQALKEMEKPLSEEQTTMIIRDSLEDK
jgi:hypothetical protein